MDRGERGVDRRQNQKSAKNCGLLYLSLFDFFTPSIVCSVDLLTTLSLHIVKIQNLKFETKIFPEKELRGLSPNFQFHVSISDLQYIFPRAVCLFCYRKISLTDT
jgi:hypothetical protein